jgi:hypothetical protein
MRRDKVTSTAVSEIGYDDKTRTLEVLFATGSLYQYFDIPPQEFEALMQSESYGRYLSSSIKGRYRYARV